MVLQVFNGVRNHQCYQRTSSVHCSGCYCWCCWCRHVVLVVDRCDCWTIGRHQSVDLVVLVDCLYRIEDKNKSCYFRFILLSSPFDPEMIARFYFYLNCDSYWCHVHGRHCFVVRPRWCGPSPHDRRRSDHDPCDQCCSYCRFACAPFSLPHLVFGLPLSHLDSTTAINGNKSKS